MLKEVHVHRYKCYIKKCYNSSRTRSIKRRNPVSEYNNTIILTQRKEVGFRTDCISINSILKKEKNNKMCVTFTFRYAYSS